MDHNPRHDLLEIYQAALKRVAGYDAVKNWLEAHPLEGPHHLFAIGKAASSMAEGALAAMGEGVTAGLVVTKHDHVGEGLKNYPQVRALEAEHPLPGPGSLAAGEALLEFIDNAPADARFLALISGGASSLAEALPDGFDAQRLRDLNNRLLAGGLDIGRMNRIRQAVSRIKGGRLAQRLGGRPATALLISDVPGDDPAVIGSGPLVPVRNPAPPELPAGLALDRSELQALPGADDPAFKSVEIHVIATLKDAVQAAAGAASERGYAVCVHDEFLEGEAGETGMRLARQLLQAEAGVHIWGGETTVHLPENPGRGGRNQHLALCAARELRQQNSVWLLSAGTDGTDGPTGDAGGLIDGGSIARGQDGGLEADRCLAAFDAGRFLEASGDLVTTGPTGTNVMDLVIGLKR